jgi:hypothetical protein
MLLQWSVSRPGILAASTSAAVLCILPCRKSWHMHDKVQLLQRLRWGELGFANLRHKGYEVWHCPECLD